MMSRLVGPDSGLKQVEVDGVKKARAKDGTFHIEGHAARTLMKTGDWAIVGTRFSAANGFICNDCNFNSVFRDRCGRCGCTNLTPESEETTAE